MNHRESSVVWLGPQRFRPSVAAALDALGVDGPIAVVTAGWQEREAEVDELDAHLGGRAVPLWLDYYRKEYDDESFRLARDLLDARIDDRFGARDIALDALIKYGSDTGRHAVVLDVVPDGLRHR